MAQMFDSSPMGISYLGPDLTFRFANKAYLDHKNETLESIKGKHLSALYEEDIFENLIDKFVEALNGTPQEFKSPIVICEHSVIYYFKLVPNLDDDENVVGVFTYYTEQTSAVR